MSNSPNSPLIVVVLLSAVSAANCEAQTHAIDNQYGYGSPTVRESRSHRLSPSRGPALAPVAHRTSQMRQRPSPALHSRDTYIPVQYETTQYAHSQEFIEHAAIGADAWPVDEEGACCDQCNVMPMACDYACNDDFAFADDPGWRPEPARPSLGCRSLGRSNHQNSDGRCLFKHQNRIFFNFLLLSTGGADLRFAVPDTGGGGGFLRPESEPGFRVGVTWGLSEKSSLDFTVTSFDPEDSARFSTGGFLIPLTTRPGTDPGITSALADYQLEIRTFDLDFKHLILGDCCFALNSRIGARFGSFDQTFRADYFRSGPATLVDSQIDFGGGGPRFGIDLEKKLSDAWVIYTRSSASFMVGEFEADYTQVGTLTDEIEDSRVVPILDFELGFSYISDSGRFRLGAGYLVSAWFNTLPMDELFTSIQNPGYSPGSETITFSGLTAHIEMRF